MFLSALLPRKISYRIAKAIGRAWYRRRRPSSDQQAENMMRRLRASEEQVNRWLSRSFELAASEHLEYSLYSRLSKENIPKLIDIHGLENLNSVLDRGRGAILHSGHVHGQLTLFAALGLLGYRPHVVKIRPGRGLTAVQRWSGQRLLDLMERRLGCRFLYISDDDLGFAVKAANALKQNAVLLIPIDHSYSRQNLQVPWLDDRARFPIGPVILAQITAAPLLPFYLHRTEKWFPQVAEIGQPFYVSDDLTQAISHCASRLEEKVRQYPEQWTTWLFPKPQLWQNLS